MNKFVNLSMLTLSFVLTSGHAFAEPRDDKSMSLIDNGSTIVLLNEVNVPGDQKLLVQDGQFFSYFGNLNAARPFCSFTTSDSSDEFLNVDSGIASGTTLVQTRRNILSDTAELSEAIILKYKTPKGNHLDISCWTYFTDSNGKRGGIPTIGQFKEITRGILELKLAPPVSL